MFIIFKRGKTHALWDREINIDGKRERKTHLWSRVLLAAYIVRRCTSCIVIFCGNIYLTLFVVFLRRNAPIKYILK